MFHAAFLSVSGSVFEIVFSVLCLIPQNYFNKLFLSEIPTEISLDWEVRRSRWPNAMPGDVLSKELLQ